MRYADKESKHIWIWAKAGLVRYTCPAMNETIVIKVIKRKTQTDIARIPTERRRVQTVTVTNTVNSWIVESRKNRLEKDNASLETIAGWTAEAHT